MTASALLLDDEILELLDGADVGRRREVHLDHLALGRAYRREEVVGREGRADVRRRESVGREFVRVEQARSAKSFPPRISAVCTPSTACSFAERRESGSL